MSTAENAALKARLLAAKKILSINKKSVPQPPQPIPSSIPSVSIPNASQQLALSAARIAAAKKIAKDRVVQSVQSNQSIQKSVKFLEDDFSANCAMERDENKKYVYTSNDSSYRQKIILDALTKDSDDAIKLDSRIDEARRNVELGIVPEKKESKTPEALALIERIKKQNKLLTDEMDEKDDEMDAYKDKRRKEMLNPELIAKKPSQTPHMLKMIEMIKNRHIQKIDEVEQENDVLSKLIDERRKKINTAQPVVNSNTSVLFLNDQEVEVKQNDIINPKTINDFDKERQDKLKEIEDIKLKNNNQLNHAEEVSNNNLKQDLLDKIENAKKMTKEKHSRKGKVRKS